MLLLLILENLHNTNNSKAIQEILDIMAATFPMQEQEIPAIKAMTDTSLLPITETNGMKEVQGRTIPVMLQTNTRIETQSIMVVVVLPKQQSKEGKQLR